MDTTARKRGKQIVIRRRAISFPVDLGVQVDRALLRLKERGQYVSFSAFVETGARELLAHADYSGILARHGASARRSMK